LDQAVRVRVRVLDQAIRVRVRVLDEAGASTVHWSGLAAQSRALV
jgi:hypothetical protein